MEEFKLKPKDQEALKSQLAVWKKWLNLFVAPLAFSGAGAALAEKEYRAWLSWLTIIFLGAIYVYARHEFPKIIEELRKKERTFREEIVYRGIVSYYFGWPSILKHFPVYFVSVVFLAAVASGVFEKLGI
jgi:uncharacterized membrane protein YfcA